MVPWGCTLPLGMRQRVARYMEWAKTKKTHHDLKWCRTQHKAKERFAVLEAQIASKKERIAVLEELKEQITERKQAKADADRRAKDEAERQAEADRKENLIAQWMAEADRKAKDEFVRKAKSLTELMAKTEAEIALWKAEADRKPKDEAELKARTEALLRAGSRLSSGVFALRSHLEPPSSSSPP